MTWFLFFCFAPILLLMYFMTRNEAKPKNNLILSTTLPKEAWEDKKVQAVIKSFKRSLFVTCLLLFLTLLPSFFIPYSSIIITYYLVWMIFLIILPSIPYCLHVKKMRELKKQYWDRPELKKVQVVDTKATEYPWKLYAPVQFILPFLLSLVPMLYPLVVPMENSPLSIYIISITNAACIALFYICYRFMIRKKSDRINGDNTLTMTLTRIRVYHWSRFWLVCAWFTALYSFAGLLLDSPVALFMIASLAYALFILVFSLKSEFTVRRAQQRYNQTEEAVILADEDDFWWYGVLYYNKNDSSTIVNNRIGFGTTFNMARPAAKIVVGFSILLLLTLPLLGVWMMKEEFTPVHIELTETSVQAYHLGKEYDVPLDKITRCELLTELPKASRNVGTGMENVYKGDFSVKGIDKNARVCLNPNAELFLVLYVGDTTQQKQKTYIFSMGDLDEQEKTREIYEIVCETLVTK